MYNSVCMKKSSVTTTDDDMKYKKILPFPTLKNIKKILLLHNTKEWFSSPLITRYLNRDFFFSFQKSMATKL